MEIGIPLRQILSDFEIFGFSRTNENPNSCVSFTYWVKASARKDRHIYYNYNTSASVFLSLSGKDTNYSFHPLSATNLHNNLFLILHNDILFLTQIQSHIHFPNPQNK